MKKIEVIQMDYHEFEKIVKRVYGATNYSFVATEECSNDSNHQFEITEVKPLDEWETKDIAEFVAKKGAKPYVNYALFQDLVNKKELEPASYMVTVCW